MAKKRDFYYMVPGTRRAALKRRLRNRIVAILVGLMAAGLLGWLLFFYHDRM